MLEQILKKLEQLQQDVDSIKQRVAAPNFDLDNLSLNETKYVEDETAVDADIRRTRKKLMLLSLNKSIENREY
jgi:hypothetical protein